MSRILILGASGYIGQALYKELGPYFDVHGTYCSDTQRWADNYVMHSFNLSKDSLTPLLEKLAPNVVIVSLRGAFDHQLKALEELCDFANDQGTIVYFLSTVNVFDAKQNHPSFETDMLLASSEYGKFKIACEKLLYAKLNPDFYGIIRLPLVIGVNAPRIRLLKESAKAHVPFEVYPNLIISCTTEDRVARKIHYIINHRLAGTFHLCTFDVIHHSDLFEEIAQKLGLENVIFKNIYESNQNRYLAILPTANNLPEQFEYSVHQIIDEVTLKEDIYTLKEKSE